MGLVRRRKVLVRSAAVSCPTTPIAQSKLSLRYFTVVALLVSPFGVAGALPLPSRPR